MKYSALVLRTGNRRRAMEFIGFCFAILCIGGVVTPCSAVVKEWISQSGNSLNWSDPANWTPPGAPQDGDEVMFHFIDGVSSPHMQMHNDLVGLRVRKVLFCGFGTTSLGWLLDGNELTVLQSVESLSGYPGQTDSCEGVLIFQCPVKLDGPTRFRMPWGNLTFRGNINLNGNDLTLLCFDNLTISGQITGVGNITAEARTSLAGSTITFDGPVGNTFSGFLSVYGNAEVVFDKQSGVVVTDGLHIGNPPGSSFDSVVCKLARSHQIGDTAEVWVHGGGQFLLDGHTETIHRLFLTNYDGDSEPSLVNTGGSTLSVLTDITAVNEATNVVPTIRGKLGLPGPETADASAVATSKMPRPLSGSKSNTPLLTTKSQNLIFTQ